MDGWIHPSPGLWAQFIGTCIFLALNYVLSSHWSPFLCKSINQSFGLRNTFDRGVNIAQAIRIVRLLVGVYNIV